MTAAFRHIRWSPWVVGGLAALALWPGGTIQALDARTGAPVPGVHLELPATSVWLEPFTAPLHWLADSPDYRHVGAWAFVWVFVGLGFAGVRQGGPLRGLQWAVTGCVGLFFWLAAGLCLPLAGWRLVPDDPAWIVADLHNHTLASHDGLVSAEQNLDTHASLGYDVVAVTDHKHPGGGFAALRSAGADDPSVLAGVEVRSPVNAYLLGIGLKPGVPVVGRTRGRDEGFEQRFIDDVHRNHGGVVLVLSHRLEPGDAERLAREGVDGFELANYGHPAPAEAVDRALRQTARRWGLPLVASSDWHGWGAWFRTWTLVRSAGDRAPPGAVLGALREHQIDRVVPVVAGPSGAVTGWRAVVAPVSEGVRYVRSLGPVRLVAWAWWVAFGFGTWRILGRWARRPGCLAGALTLAAGSFVVGARGALWIVAGTGGTPLRPFPAEVGTQLLVVALVGLGTAWSFARRAGLVFLPAARPVPHQASSAAASEFS